MRKASGISLMLLIFLSLSLIIFSLLSLSSATADLRLSEKSAQRTIEYYAAEAEACRTLLKIEDYVSTGHLAETDSDDLVSFTVPVNEKQILLVKFEPDFDKTGKNLPHRIHTWKVVTTSEWVPDTSIRVLER